jgi:Tol biopolymer transport system component
MHRLTMPIFTLIGSLGFSLIHAEVIVPAQALQKVSLDGVIDQDNDDTLAFTPDQKTVFFDRTSGPHKTIMIAHKVHGRWRSAHVAGFSGRWFDQDPVVSPDGRYMLFNSDRPVSPGGRPLVQTYAQPVETCDYCVTRYTVTRYRWSYLWPWRPIG